MSVSRRFTTGHLEFENALLFICAILSSSLVAFLQCNQSDLVMLVFQIRIKFVVSWDKTYFLYIHK